MADARRSRHPVVELTLARFRILIREPEAFFWAFVFPILMTVALGIAFRAAPAGIVPVAVVQGAHAAHLVAVLEREPSVDAFTIGRAEVYITLRDGRAHLVVEPGTPPVYRYDPTRPRTGSPGSWPTGRCSGRRGGATSGRRATSRSLHPAGATSTGSFPGCSA